MKFQLKAAVILALLAGFAFAASNAMAQAMGSSKESEATKISGGADASFGTFSEDKLISKKVESASGFGGTIQSNIIFSGKKGSVDYYVRLRLRGQKSKVANNGGESANTLDDGQLQTARVRLRWRPSSIFNVSVGRLPGIGGVGKADRQPGRALVRPGGVDLVAFFDSPSIDLKFTPGPLTVGYVIGKSAQTLAFTAGVKGIDRTSTGLYAQYKGGPLFVGFRSVSYVGKGTAAKAAVTARRVQYVNNGLALAANDPVTVNGEAGTAVGAIAAGAAGVVAITAAGENSGLKYEEEASATVLEASFKTGGFYGALEISSGDQVVATKDRKGVAITGDKATAPAYAATALYVEYKFGAHKAYLLNTSQTRDEVKKAKKDISGMAIGYLRDVGPKAVVGVETASSSSKATDAAGKAGKDLAKSSLRFIIISGF